MATQHNVFVRKFGKLAVLITVTDWEDFKELEKHATSDEDGEKHESPDFLLSGVTSKSIYSNMNPQITVATRGEVKDITEETKGFGLAGIITGSAPCGPLWQFRKIDGFVAVEEFSKPSFKEQ